jgi:hypothetical protein
MAQNHTSTKETLRRIAKGKPYRTHLEWSEDRGWLTWSAHSDEQLDEHFPLPATFLYSAALSSPSVKYLRYYRKGIPNFEKREADLKELSRKYQADDGYVKEKLLPALVARRDAIETQLHRNGERLRSGPLTKIRSLLMVWLAEALDDSEDTFSVHHHAGGIWQNISSGMTLDELRESEWLDKIQEHGSKILAKAQRARIEEVLEDRAPILEESDSLREQHRLCERLVLAAINDEPVPPFETMRNRENPITDHRAVHLPQKDWIVNKYWKIKRANNYTNAETIEKVQIKYAERFGDLLRDKHGDEVNVMPSEKTIRDYRDGNR